MPDDRQEPSLLLHPLDFLGGDDDSALEVLPRHEHSGARKVELVGEFIDSLSHHFNTVPMGIHAAAISKRTRLPSRTSG